MSETKKFEVKSTAVLKVVDPIIDVGNMLLIDHDPIEGDPSENLIERARNNAQMLFNNIWQLERKHVDSSILAILPKPSFRLPREKKMPEKKEETKWEKYAAAKGIKKRTKDKKVFDDKTGEWKPTWGYRRGNDNTKDWLVVVPGNAADPNKDYIAERMEKKKERIAKNEMQRMKNLAKTMGTKMRKGPSVDAQIGLGMNPKEKTKEQLRFSVDRAKVATASAGKFQDKIRGEKENKKTGVKRKFVANETTGVGEKQRALEILQKMSVKKARIVEEKATAVAGAEKKEKKDKKNKGNVRQKSQIHRQQWFQAKKKDNKNTRGNSKKSTGKKK